MDETYTSQSLFGHLGSGRPEHATDSARRRPRMAVDYLVIVVYLAGMLAMGWWGMRRARSKSEFLVAGRRLGPAMYSGTMAAIVLGGASTIGGVGLGYQYGLSGAWMVFTIGLGLLALSVFFSARIARLKVYTVRSEEHTSELQSRENLVCRLLL